MEAIQKDESIHNSNFLPHNFTAIVLEIFQSGNDCQVDIVIPWLGVLVWLIKHTYAYSKEELAIVLPTKKANIHLSF